ncbi:ephrin-A4-like isoform X2 [Lethenteron reissneri]|uniref:ephrin-A4-like isoform X2 n=1 Tax=Lethenteron reissneri TaxID=7753 RepID=UPI002AB78B19|nr:ephrin-A4-like isoform X2 [Lethenteron reissneri]
MPLLPLPPPLPLLLPLLLLLLCGVGRCSSARFAVYWNSSNHRLLTGDYTLTVHIDDYMDVYCPHSTAPELEGPELGGSLAGGSTPPPPPPAERPVLHMVDAAGFARCEHSRGSVRWRCGRPLQRGPHHRDHGAPLRFAEKFQRFTPFSLGFEFAPGQDYYYISTPLLKGDSRCYRLKVHVCCGPDEPRVAAAVGTGAAGATAPRGGGPAMGLAAAAAALLASRLL